MSYGITAQDIAAMRAGWYFDTTTVPTLSVVTDEIIPDAVAEIDNTMRLALVDLDALVDPDHPDHDPAALRQVRVLALYLAAAMTAERQFGQPDNTYRQRYDELRLRFLAQPQSYGAVVRERPYPGEPVPGNAPEEESLQSRGPYSGYLRVGGGF